MTDEKLRETARDWMEGNLCGDCCHDEETDESLFALLCQVRDATEQDIRNEPMNREHYARLMRERDEEWDRTLDHVFREHAVTPYKRGLKGEIRRRMGRQP